MSSYQNIILNLHIKKYEYLLRDKQSTLDNYVKYLHTACELAKINKIQVIEIVKNKKEE